MRYFYNPPGAIKNIFNKSIWESKVNKILLTFDDGPNPGTSQIILDQLNKKSLKAVFFCVGQNIEKYPEIAGQIINEGHTIANHTFSHASLTFLSKKNVVEQLIKFNNIYESNFNSSPRYFRPPRGHIRLNLEPILRKHDLNNVMWSLLTYDYKNDLNIVKFAVTNFMRGNSIIVLHDNLKCKDIIKDSINFITSHAEKRGFVFGEPAECLK